MRKSERMSYVDKIRWRTRACFAVLALMAVYMVVIAEFGGGDSRIVSGMADMVGDLIFFGGAIYLVCRIYHNKKLLKNRALLREQLREEQDERNQYLHDKSGGTVLDILLLFLLFVTTTTAQFDMAAFYTSFALLAAAIGLKAVFYILYSR